MENLGDFLNTWDVDAEVRQPRDQDKPTEGLGLGQRGSYGLCGDLDLGVGAWQ